MSYLQEKQTHLLISKRPKQEVRFFPLLPGLQSEANEGMEKDPSIDRSAKAKGQLPILRVCLPKERKTYKTRTLRGLQLDSSRTNAPCGLFEAA